MSFDKDVEIYYLVIGIVGCVFFILIFFLLGIIYFIDIDGYVLFMLEVVLVKVFWVLILGVVELVGVVMIFFNWWLKFGVWFIVIFLVLVIFVVYGYEMVNVIDEMMWGIQMLFFFKGLMMIGVVLFFIQFGVWCEL